MRLLIAWAVLATLPASVCRQIIPLAARHADGWDAPLGPSAEAFAHKVRVLGQACAAIGRDPATVRRSAHVAVVGDQAELQAKFGRYAYDTRPGGVLMGVGYGNSFMRLADTHAAARRAGRSGAPGLDDPCR